MKTRKKGFCQRLLALSLSLMVMLASAAAAMPAKAANVAPTENLTTTFDKYLVMSTDANVPPVTFNFTIAAGEPEEAVGSAPAIYAGLPGATVDPAVFTAADTANTEVQSGDSVSLDENQKYAKKEVQVDFTDVSFTAPGVYRYVITETNDGASGVTYDAAPRTLDVYVGYVERDGVVSDTTLEVMGYVLHDGTVTAPAEGEGNKGDGFVNSLTTYNLTLEKDVQGNQGNRDKYFAFTVTISEAVEGTKYTVDLTSADTNLTVDGEAKTNEAEIVVETGKTVTKTYYLKDNQSIVIKGLTPATQYTIAEMDYSTDGYSTEYQLDNAGAVENRTVNGTMGDASHAVLFTNTKTGSVPTGILLETAPYLTLGAVVLAGFALLFVTRRRRAH